MYSSISHTTLLFDVMLSSYYQLYMQNVHIWLPILECLLLHYTMNPFLELCHMSILNFLRLKSNVEIEIQHQQRRTRKHLAVCQHVQFDACPTSRGAFSLDFVCKLPAHNYGTCN